MSRLYKGYIYDDKKLIGYFDANNSNFYDILTYYPSINIFKLSFGNDFDLIIERQKDCILQHLKNNKNDFLYTEDYSTKICEYVNI